MRPQTIVESVRVIGVTTTVVTGRLEDVPSVSVVRRHSVMMMTITIMVKDVVHHLEERNVIKILMVIESVTMGL